MSLVVKYLEGTRFEIKCRSHSVITDQPKSENGTDQGITPVELFIASLASCATYYASIYLSRRVNDLTGLEVRSSWNYSEDPHRISSINLIIVTPCSLSDHERNGLLRSVEHCTIKNTLKHNPIVKIDINFFRK